MPVKIETLKLENVKCIKAVSLTPSQNGLTVERKGKNASLKVIDPHGKKSGQQLLDSFVSELVLNLT